VRGSNGNNRTIQTIVMVVHLLNFLLSLVVVAHWSCLVRARIIGALGIVTTLTANYGVKQSQFTKPTSEPLR